MPLVPYTGPFGRAQLLHLLRRSLFGATPADLAHFDGLSLDAVIDELLTFTNDTAPPVKSYAVGGDPNALDPSVPFGTTWVDTPRDPPDDTDVIQARLVSWAAWWMRQLTGQQRNLREKLTLFWHDHMPTQLGVVFHSEASYRMQQLLRTQCGGNFRQLIHDVTVEPAMLIYLNGRYNVSFAPDENYGRELFELFTCGHGSGYTEGDVQAAARVLTGWGIQEDIDGTPILPQTIFRPLFHTATDKQFSAFFNNTVITGQSGADAGEVELNALLDMIMAQEACSLSICRALYRFFVHGDIAPEVETDVIQPLAELFRQEQSAPDQIRTVLRALLTSTHFFSDDVIGCMVKSPADLVIGDIRMFGFPLPDTALNEADLQVHLEFYWLVSYAGQTLAEPPNVAGWPAYYLHPAYDRLWLDTATFPARNNALLSVIYSTIETPSDTVLPASADLSFRTDLVAFTQELQNPANPNALIDQLVELMYVHPISPAVKQQLKQAYLLFGQTNDIYWSDAYELYVADPNTTSMTAQLVPDILRWLVGDMQKAAERHLY